MRSKQSRVLTSSHLSPPIPHSSDPSSLTVQDSLGVPYPQPSARPEGAAVVVSSLSAGP